MIIAIIFLFDQKHIGEFLGIPCNRVNVRVKRIGKSNVEIPNKVICDCIFFFCCMLPWIFNRIMIETYQIMCVCVLFLGGAFGGKAIDIVPQTGIASVAAWK